MPRFSLLLLFLPLSLHAQAEATVHQEFSYQLPKPALTWTAVEGLPSGLIIIPEDARIWGAPNQAGEYKLPLKASDGTQITLDLKVNALWNLSLTPPQAAVGVRFFHRQVVGGGVPPYAFNASPLPPGLKISPDGLISGTPTEAGNFSPSIGVADRQGNKLVLPYNLHVNPIAITTTDLPPIQPGAAAYSQQLAAIGGKPPYTWSLLGFFSCPDLIRRPVMTSSYVQDPSIGMPFDSNSRPPGNLSSDGVLTVQTPQSYDQTFCVQVADSAGNKAKASLTAISLAPGQYPFSASLSTIVIGDSNAFGVFLFTPGDAVADLLLGTPVGPNFGEASVGDPVTSTVFVYDGTSPYTAKALLLPPGFVFLPGGIAFGYPQTPGVYTIRIQANDGAGATAIAESDLPVTPIRVGSSSPGLPTYGKPYSRQYYAVNADAPHSWELLAGSQLPAGLTFSSHGLLSGTPQEAGYFSTQARITDAQGNTRRFGLPSYVSAGTPETLETTSPDNPVLTLNRQSSYALTVSSVSPYKWSTSGALPPGMVEVDDPNGSLTLWGVPSVAGSYPVSVRVTDAKSNAGIHIIPLVVTPLYSDSLKLPDIVAGVSAQIQLPVDGGTAPYKWSVAPGSSLPPGLTLSNSGVLSGSSPKSDTFQFTVLVTDAASNSVNLQYTLQVDAIQILTPRTPPPLTIGQPFSLQLEAISAAAGYVWTLQNPSCPLNGLTLNADGLLSGTPNVGGTAFCGIAVTDAQGNSAVSAFIFLVVGLNQTVFAAAISGPISGKVSTGIFFSVPLYITGVAPVSVAAAPGSDLPPGLSLSTTALSGFPTKAGSYAFGIEVTDALGATATTRAYITVSPVHIVSIFPSGVYNQPYSYQLRTLENQVQPVRWTVSPTDRIPAGLQLSPDGLLSGTPVETGPFTFTVRANDATAAVTLTIDSGSYTYYAKHELPIPANLGVPFAHSLVASGGASFSFSSGALPPGLTLSPQGNIVGTPTTAGVYTFTVRLDGPGGGFGIGVVTIRVGVIQSQNRASPSATVGTPYAAQLQGGTLAPGDSLPPGLTLTPDGKLTGTPTAAWFYQFSVVLNDAPGDFVTSTYTLEVLSGVPPI
jgi:hypothetical protein